tara:strand:+ start:94 stop:1644 length:1551 start_codon:yes stop_codon:yes gene_type:complete
MKKHSKKQERKKNERKKKKEKRKQKLGRERIERRKELPRRESTGRTVLGDEFAHRRTTGVVAIDTVRPSDNEECICGSELNFSDCCARTLHEGSEAITVARRLLEENQYEAALPWCRAHLSWYILCHRAHTVPRQKAADPIARKILAIDIEALDVILRRVERCYRETGQAESFRHVLDAMEGVVADQRWADKLSLHRALWWEIVKNDGASAAELIAEVDVSECRDAEVLAKYVTLRTRQLSFDERVTLMRRVCELTEEQPIKFQFRCLVGISYLLVCEQEKAVELITIAVDQYRSLAKDERSWFGDHLFAQSMFLLGSLQDSDELVLEAENCFAKFLNPESKVTLTPLGRSEYRMHVGRCKAFLGEHHAAIEQYDIGLANCDIPLTRIYKAEALVSCGELETGRKLLDAIDTKSLSMVNRHDYAMARTMLAVATQQETDNESAKLALKAFEASDPLWVQQRDKWLITLLETAPCADPGVISKTIRLINRYLILQPNFFGLGVNINNALEDLDKRPG